MGVKADWLRTLRLDVATATAYGASSAAPAGFQLPESRMPAVIEQFTADSMALDGTYPVGHFAGTDGTLREILRRGAGDAGGDELRRAL